MARQVDFVVIGGGLAGATCAETLRAEGATGSILLIGEESALPYQRPPLSKTFITSTQETPPRPVVSEARFQELGIEVVLSAHVLSVDARKHLVTIGANPGAAATQASPRAVKHRDGHASKHASADDPTRAPDRTADQIRFGHLLIATGASPIRLSIPGADLSGVHYLRSIDDAHTLREDALTAKRAVVIGASFVGVEVAASLCERGIAVTIVEERASVLGTMKTPALSDFFKSVLEVHGVEVLLHDTPLSFAGGDRVTSVVTHGGRTLPCDMVVVGIGVTPDTAFLHGSGITVNHGVMVDRFLQTNHHGIYAAGDVANFFDPVFNEQHRIEHWDNAIRQGRLAARNMLGRREPYDAVSYFFSHVFELNFNLLGRIEEPYEKIDRGSLESGSFASFYLRNDVPRALFSLGRPSEETKIVEQLIRNRTNIRDQKAHLADPAFKLSSIPSQTVLILQGGGAYGAFEYGAVKALVESGVRPAIVSGVSIGAFNGAVIAGNPDHPVEALEGFWADLATISPIIPDEHLRRSVASNQIAMFGVPNFFTPRWLMPTFSFGQMPQHWSSLYDMSPARALLTKYVDFDRLAKSPIRLLVSAVDIETSELVIFDSYAEKLTPEHILASGSLPPAFQWTTIKGHHYWDGGIVSNSPLEIVIERCGATGKQVYVIDLFPGKRTHLPENLMEVMTRRDEILYSERIRSDTRTERTLRDFRKLVEDIQGDLPLQTARRLRSNPLYIQLMGEDAPMQITRIVRENSDEDGGSRDYDFSASTLQQLVESGYAMARKAIGK